MNNQNDLTEILVLQRSFECKISKEFCKGNFYFMFKFTNNNKININNFMKFPNKFLNFTLTLLVIYILPLFYCAKIEENSKGYSFNFSTAKLDSYQEKLNSKSLKLLNFDLRNSLNDSYVIKSETHYNDLKISAQQICSDLKRKLSQTNQNYSLIQSVFPSYISTIRIFFKSFANATKLSNFNISLMGNVDYYDWLKDDSNNESLTNITTRDEFFAYTVDNLYLIFPIISIFIFIFLIAAIFNCLYCNFCYCCSYRFTTKVRQKNFFNKLAVFIIIFAFIFVGIFVFIQLRISEIYVYANYLTCELNNKNVLTFLSNIDYAIDSIEEKNYKKGLIQLRNTLNSSYIQDLNNLKNLVDSTNSISHQDPLYEVEKSIINGLKDFNDYVIKNFAFSDIDNNEADSNIKYKCLNCKELMLDISKISK